MLIDWDGEGGNKLTAYAFITGDFGSIEISGEMRRRSIAKDFKGVPCVSVDDLLAKLNSFVAGGEINPGFYCYADGCCCTCSASYVFHGGNAPSFYTVNPSVEDGGDGVVASMIVSAGQTSCRREWARPYHKGS